MRRWVGGLGVVAAATAIAGFLGCRQAIGIDQYFNAPAEAGSDAGVTACGLPYGTIPCAACAQANCCKESHACATDPSCAPYESCFGECNGDPKCWEQCLADHPATTPGVSALSACMARACETECRLTCGAFAAFPVEVSAADACQACIESKACAETRACARSSECDSIERCMNACVTRDCMDGCVAVYGQQFSFSADAGAQDADVRAAFEGARTGCNSDCRFGNYWPCVGHVSWPAPKSASYTYNLWVKDYSTSSGVANAQVSLCSFTDVGCNVAIQTGTTDPSGEVTFRLQNVQNAGGQQSLGLTGYFAVSGPNLVPAYYYWGFPLSDVVFASYTEVTTPSEFQNLFTSVNVVSDLSRATVAVAVYDCRFSAAPGVNVTLSTADSLTKPFTPTGAMTSITDQAAIVIFDNVPAGNLEVVATPMAIGTPAAKVHATARAGASTTVLVFPTPL